jgi:hypothetical protein
VFACGVMSPSDPAPTAAGLSGTAQPPVRRFFDGAARAWVRRAIDDATLTLVDLQKASPATRALVTAQSRLSGYRGSR